MESDRSIFNLSIAPHSKILTAMGLGWVSSSFVNGVNESAWSKIFSKNSLRGPWHFLFSSKSKIALKRPALVNISLVQNFTPCFVVEKLPNSQIISFLVERHGDSF